MQREGLDTRMSKIAIVTDSNSGITQAEGARRGIHVLPMPFMIDEVTYYEDIDLTQEQFYQKLKEGGEIKTSMPLVGDVTDKWDELLKEYDEIVYIPMSSGLSRSCETAYMLSQDYDRKVQVVNNQRISVTMRQSVLDAKMLAEQGKGAEEIKEILEKENFEHFSFDWYSDTIKNEATGLTARETAKHAYDTAVNFVRNFDSGCQNLFLYGSTGVGKTFLSHCIARELLKTAHCVLYFSAFDLFDKLAQNTFARKTETDPGEDFIYDCDLLIIDDLGTELSLIHI